MKKVIVSVYRACKIIFFFISVQNLPTGSHRCPDPTPAHGSIVILGTVRPNTGIFILDDHVAVACDERFVMNVNLGNHRFALLGCEGHGIWSRIPPDCIPNHQGE